MHFTGHENAISETEAAMRTHLNNYATWSKFNGLPVYAVDQQSPVQGREGFPDQSLSSQQFTHQATKDPILLEIGAEFLIGITTAQLIAALQQSTMCSLELGPIEWNLSHCRNVEIPLLVVDPDHWPSRA